MRGRYIASEAFVDGPNHVRASYWRPSSPSSSNSSLRYFGRVISSVSVVIKWANLSVSYADEAR